MENFIFLVVEDGTGFIHKAFYTYEKAKEYMEKLEYETNFECFEVIKVEIEKN